MLELLEQEQPEIFLGERRIDERQRYTLKRQIPSCKPRELPLVGHGENAHGVQVAPVQVTQAFAGIGRREFGIVPFHPAVDVPVIKQLAPEHPGERLPLDPALFRSGFGGIYGFVEFVGFCVPGSDGFLDRTKWILQFLWSQPKAQYPRFARSERLLIPDAGFGATLRGIDGRLTVNHVAVKAVFHVRLWIVRASVEPDRVIFVVCEARPSVFLRIEETPSDVVLKLQVEKGVGRVIFRHYAKGIALRIQINNRLAAARICPPPRIAKPEM